ncbi:hypothetical protein LOTGIDRAFT_170642 [Lottia gigantea]|uniref:Uncharacterized protein n=1 Tax=Lottia gigantea TaxID=225164 RepID=V4CQ22_LOTGI|nr:hypothetical protein LOTGIDRAFT_170642 [Lottia gigantea]ESP04550.1 hypothetical protein LOTGIDRAFT_170642 [Lottia gigantea]
MLDLPSLRIYNHMLLLIAAVGVSISMMLIPSCTSFAALLIVLMLMGWCMGCLDCLANLRMILLFGKNVSPFLQAMHCCYGFGAFVSPMIASSFLLNRDCSPYVDGFTLEPPVESIAMGLNRTISVPPQPRKVFRYTHMSRLPYAFYILGGLQMCIAAVVLSLVVREKFGGLVSPIPDVDLGDATINEDASKSSNILSRLNCCAFGPQSVVMLALLASVSLFLYDGLQSSYANYIYTFAQESDVPIEKYEGAILDACFWNCQQKQNARNCQQKQNARNCQEKKNDRNCKQKQNASNCLQQKNARNCLRKEECQELSTKEECQELSRKEECQELSTKEEKKNARNCQLKKNARNFQQKQNAKDCQEKKNARNCQENKKRGIPGIVNKRRMPGIFNKSRMPIIVNKRRMPGIVNKRRMPGIVKKRRMPGIYNKSRMPGIVNCQEKKNDRNCQEKKNARNCQEKKNARNCQQKQNARNCQEKKKRRMPGIVNKRRMPGIFNKSRMSRIVNKRRMPGIVNKGRMPGIVNKSRMPRIVNKSRMPGIVNKSRMPGIVNRSRMSGIVNKGRMPGVVKKRRMTRIVNKSGMPGIGLFAFGRLIAIFLAAKFTAAFMLLCDIIGCAIAILITIIFRSSNIAIYLGTCLAGIFISSMSPSAMSMMEQYIDIKSSITTCLVVAACLGEALCPIIVGNMVVSLGSVSFLAFCFAMVLLSFVLYWLMFVAGKEMPKYQANGKRSFVFLRSNNGTGENTVIDPSSVKYYTRMPESDSNVELAPLPDIPKQNGHQ